MRRRGQRGWAGRTPSRRPWRSAGLAGQCCLRGRADRQAGSSSGLHQQCLQRYANPPVAPTCLAHFRLPRLQPGAVCELLPQVGGREHTLFPIHSVSLLWAGSRRSATAGLPLAVGHLQGGAGRRCRQADWAGLGRLRRWQQEGTARASCLPAACSALRWAWPCAAHCALPARSCLTCLAVRHAGNANAVCHEFSVEQGRELAGAACDGSAADVGSCMRAAGRMQGWLC